MGDPLNFRTGGRRKKRRDQRDGEDSLQDSLLDETRDQRERIGKPGINEHHVDSELSVSRSDRAAGAGNAESYPINKPSRRPDAGTAREN